MLFKILYLNKLFKRNKSIINKFIYFIIIYVLFNCIKVNRIFKLM